MSASTSSVVSPRKGKHSRSSGQTISQSASSSLDATSRFNAVQSADPLTLDPDDAFVKLSVREIQTIEAGLRSSHDYLSGKLRSLVSERYRDMLGTANTLIEMSSSATNLVKRLDAVRSGIDKASLDTEGGRSATGDQNGQEAAQSQEEREKAAVFSIAAVTKLLAESPDEVWRAVDSASLTSAASGSGKRALVGRGLSDFKSATALRAAWIYTLCEQAWEWLGKGLQGAADGEGSQDVKTLFPYVSKQWLTLAPMSARIINVAHTGLAGWYSAEASGGKRWEEVSSSYMATTTFLLTIALLQPSFTIVVARDTLLQCREKAIVRQLRRGRGTPAQTLTRLIKCMADTIMHCLRAFVLAEHSSTGVAHFASVCKDVGSGQEQGQYPPRANQALSTLPSNIVLAQNLPATVRQFTPYINIEDAEQCKQTTTAVLCRWSMSIRDEAALSNTIEGLDTIASIGEAQSLIWESFDRCLIMADKASKPGETLLRSVIEEELRSLVELIEASLLKRLNSLCRKGASELSRAVSQSTSSALQQLDGVAGQTQHVAEMEKSPVRFMFEGETSSGLHDRLRMQTPLVQQVLSSVEERAESLAEEIDAYSMYVQEGVWKRARRQKRRGRQGDGLAISNGQESKTRAVIESYQGELDAARLTIVDELHRQLEHIKSTSAASAKGPHRLMVARIALSLQHSSILGEKRRSGMASKGGSDVFVERLAALRKQEVDAWLSYTVKEAVTVYSVRVVAQLDPHLDEVRRPTSALVESLLRLVDGLHALGCGYLHESVSLSEEMLSAFVKSWTEVLPLQLDDKHQPSYTFDSDVLAILLREWNGDKATALVGKLEEVSGGGGKMDRGKQGEMEVALQRLRLVLHPIRPPVFNADRRGQIDSSSTAPALPMLSIVKGREKVALL